ncbi:MAG: YciI family protein [Ignavibacteriaceae bacterium]
MEDFLLIFRHEDDSKISQEEMDRFMKDATKWVNTIEEKKKFLGGKGLSFDDAKVVWHNNVVTDGPFGEIKETLGGFIIVKANSVDEAVDFAKECPILQKEGNTVEIRKIARGDGVQ